MKPLKNKHNELIIFGTGETALMAYEYFTHDSPYRVAAFTVEKQFIHTKRMFGVPVVSFETITNMYPPKRYEMFVAISYTDGNRLRAKFFARAQKKGYRLASYISTHAFVWPTAAIGRNCFILENNVIQHGVTIGDNVTLWSGNHIGHQTHIADHVFVSSHCVISGYCNICSHSFLGVNSTYNDHITVEPDCIIGSGAVLIRNTEKGKTYVGNPARAL